MTIESDHVESGESLENEIEEKIRELKGDFRLFRFLNIRIMVPRKIRRNSIEDLDLMLSSLRNAISVCSVYVSKIEREHQKRCSAQQQSS